MAATVLLADDSPQARRMGTAYLSDLGYGVEAVADGAAALAALARLAPPPCLILADAALPGLGAAGELGGMELLRQVRARPDWAAIPVLLLLGALARVGEAELAGADGILRKPLSSAGLERWLPRQGAAASPAPAPAPADPLTPEQMLVLAVRAAALAES